MELPFFQVDAFTDRLFRGNPAAVCLLRSWPCDELLQAVARENNLSETAYVRTTEEGLAIRWFTPEVEVDLCGHATLAAAWCLFHRGETSGDVLSFDSRGGPLVVRRDGERLELDFPSRPPVVCYPPTVLYQALGRRPQDVLRAVDYLAVYHSAEEVAQLRPDMRLLQRLDTAGLMVTAPGDGEIDFVSRYFAPRQGIEEDPVTGSAQCTLTPYWANRLNKTELRARQISRRGGELRCRMHGDRVRIAGHAVLFAEGTIHLPDGDEREGA